ncbi:MAG: hypothetical protein LBH05_02500 [Deferribacteraceae bacterium]|jgi:hypothetical protein|nr:hypothetical protein [Deferribacteraceae bacterium]
MKNYINVSMMGIRAFSDRYIVSADDELCYASFYGGAEAVKAVVAGMLEGNEVRLDERKVVRNRLSMNYESTRLSNAVTHIVVYVPELFVISGQGTFILTGNSYADISKKAYDILVSCRPTPLIEEWRDFITNNQIWINEMESFGIPYAAMVNFPETEALDEFVMENIIELAEMKQ